MTENKRRYAGFIFVDFWITLFTETIKNTTNTKTLPFIEFYTEPFFVYGGLLSLHTVYKLYCPISYRFSTSTNNRGQVCMYVLQIFFFYMTYYFIFLYFLYFPGQ